MASLPLFRRTATVLMTRSLGWLSWYVVGREPPVQSITVSERYRNPVAVVLVTAEGLADRFEVFFRG